MQNNILNTSLFKNSNQVSKGRANVDTVMQVAGGVLAVTSSALGIALAIKQLKG